MGACLNKYTGRLVLILLRLVHFSPPAKTRMYSMGMKYRIFTFSISRMNSSFKKKGMGMNLRFCSCSGPWLSVDLVSNMCNIWGACQVRVCVVHVPCRLVAFSAAVKRSPRCPFLSSSFAKYTLFRINTRTCGAKRSSLQQLLCGPVKPVSWSRQTGRRRRDRWQTYELVWEDPSGRRTQGCSRVGRPPRCPQST